MLYTIVGYCTCMYHLTRLYSYQHIGLGYKRLGLHSGCLNENYSDQNLCTLRRLITVGIDSALAFTLSSNEVA